MFFATFLQLKIIFELEKLQKMCSEVFTQGKIMEFLGG
jgi:hypothetical protein